MAHWTKIWGMSQHIKAIVFDGQIAGNIVGWESSGEWEVGYWSGRNTGARFATQALLLF